MQQYQGSARHYQDDQQAPTVIDLMSIEPSPVAQLERVAIDVQIATAKRFPRSVKAFLANCRADIAVSAEVAGRMRYSLPARGDGEDARPIIGPSVRLAEVMAARWGNASVQPVVTMPGPQDRYVTVAAFAHDLESNYRVCETAVRQIYSRNNKRYSDNMIQVTAAAAVSIAFRNAVLRMIPRAYVDELMEHARKVVAGDERLFGERMAEFLRYAATKKYDVERIVRSFGKSRPEDLTGDDLAEIKARFVSISDNSASFDEVFPVEGEAPPAPSEPVLKRPRRGPSQQVDAATGEVIASRGAAETPSQASPDAAAPPPSSQLALLVEETTAWGKKHHGKDWDTINAEALAASGDPASSQDAYRAWCERVVVVNAAQLRALCSMATDRHGKAAEDLTRGVCRKHGHSGSRKLIPLNKFQDIYTALDRDTDAVRERVSEPDE